MTRRLGRVDDGTTQTDSLELERRRGITIRSAVVSFSLEGLQVNLVDTPGHPDFIAEVERVLGILGEKVAYARMFSGEIAARAMVALHAAEPEATAVRTGKLTSAGVFEAGTATRDTAARSGDIVVLRGLADVRAGDQFRPPGARQ